jgi:hypothetical protein
MMDRLVGVAGTLDHDPVTIHALRFAADRLLIHFCGGQEVPGLYPDADRWMLQTPAATRQYKQVPRVCGHIITWAIQ